MQHLQLVGLDPQLRFTLGSSVKRGVHARLPLGNSRLQVTLTSRQQLKRGKRDWQHALSFDICSSLDAAAACSTDTSEARRALSASTSLHLASQAAEVCSRVERKPVLMFFIMTNSLRVKLRMPVECQLQVTRHDAARATRGPPLQVVDYILLQPELHAQGLDFVLLLLRREGSGRHLHHEVSRTGHGPLQAATCCSKVSAAAAWSRRSF
jgi:hypothetical protein